MSMPILFRSRVRLLVCLAVALVDACAGERILPAPGDQLVPGERQAASALVEGVRTIVQAGAWNGEPAGLPAQMTPLKVTIENSSQHPLRVRYNEFTLGSSAGFTYRALPPYKITGSNGEPALVPRFAYSGFLLAPYYYGPYFGGIPAWGYPWPYDSVYYDDLYGEWPVQLPTRDMRQAAIPEGVVQPGGTVSGFLYFPDLPRDVGGVTFHETLIDAATKAQFGDVRIPFVVEH
jgi:hypothetical protein